MFDVQGVNMPHRSMRVSSSLTALSAVFLAGLVTLPPVVARAVDPEQASETASAGQQPAGAQAAILRGRVTDESGAPLAGVCVRVVAVADPDKRTVEASTQRYPIRTVLICRTDEASHEDDLALECVGIGDCQELKAWATRVGELRSAGSGAKLGIRARKQAEIGASRIVRERDLQNGIGLRVDGYP
jgi:hypothetical protein